jgi:hypothetical protein
MQLPEKADAAPRKQLETRHLVVSSSEHTAEGKHAAVVQSWEDWAAGAKGRVRELAGGLTLADAGEALRQVGLVVGESRERK